MPFANPSSNIHRLSLDEGMIVADIGCGSGAYALEASRRVGERGRVFAIDVQKELLSRLKTTAAREGLTNIDIVCANVEKIGSTKLENGIIDVAILSNILFQVDDAPGAVVEVARILRKGGRAGLIDWSGSFGGIGPAEKDVLSPEKATEIFERAGFSLLQKFDAGDHHYGLIFRKT